MATRSGNNRRFQEGNALDDTKSGLERLTRTTCQLKVRHMLAGKHLSLSMPSQYPISKSPPFDVCTRSACIIKVVESRGRAMEARFWRCFSASVPPHFLASDIPKHADPGLSFPRAWREENGLKLCVVCVCIAKLDAPPTAVGLV